MAEKDFVVKNGLIVNGAITINSTAFYFNGTPFANNSYYTGKANTANLAIDAWNANNSTYLNNVPASSYVNTTGNYTVSGNINFTGTNNYFTGANVTYTVGFKVGANLTANTSALFVGNATVNAVVNSSGLYTNGVLFQSGGGFYKGNFGDVGNTVNKGNLYRINGNTQTANVTITAGENALVAGPLRINTGINLIIETGGRVVVI